MRSLGRKIKMFIFDLYYKISNYQNLASSNRHTYDQHGYIVEQNRQLLELMRDMNQNFTILNTRCLELEKQIERIKGAGILERFEKLKVME